MPTFGSSIVYISQTSEVCRGNLLITTLYGTCRPTPSRYLRLKLVRSERHDATVDESIHLAKGDIAYVCGTVTLDEDEDIMTVNLLNFTFDMDIQTALVGFILFFNIYADGSHVRDYPPARSNPRMPA